MKIEYRLDALFSGAEMKAVVDLPDDYTEDDVSKDFCKWLSDFIVCEWKRID